MHSKLLINIESKVRDNTIGYIINSKELINILDKTKSTWKYCNSILL